MTGLDLCSPPRYEVFVSLPNGTVEVFGYDSYQMAYEEFTLWRSRDHAVIMYTNAAPEWPDIVHEFEPTPAEAEEV